MAEDLFKLDNLFNQAKTAPIAGRSDDELLANTSFTSRVVDQINGKFILRSYAHVDTPEGRVAFAALRGKPNLNIQITQGQAIVQTDRYSGETLITPKGDIPVLIRPVLETTLRDEPITIVGDEYEVGIDIRNVPFDQLRFEQGGGGACAASHRFEQFDFELRVRAFMPANVIPLDKDRRRINWHHALYFAHDPKIGFMRLHYNPALQSQTNLRSRAPRESIKPENFFPADGENNLYFIIEMLDLGLSCFNPKPMTQIYENIEWPPYSTVLNISEPVDFYNTEHPEQLMITIHKNDMQIYDYSSIEVELLNNEIDNDGLLKSRWRITNQSMERGVLRWFALGNFRKDGRYPDQGSRLVGPAKSGMETFEVEFRAPLEKSTLPQFITLNAVSLNDPVLLGTQKLEFVYPSDQT